MGVSENRGPWYGTLSSRIPIIRTPKYGTPYFRKLPYSSPLYPEGVPFEHFGHDLPVAEPVGRGCHSQPLDGMGLGFRV